MMANDSLLIRRDFEARNPHLRVTEVTSNNLVFYLPHPFEVDGIRYEPPRQAGPPIFQVKTDERISYRGQARWTPNSQEDT